MGRYSGDQKTARLMAADCQAIHHRLIRDTSRIGRFCFWSLFMNSGQKKATQTSGAKGSLFKIRRHFSPAGQNIGCGKSGVWRPVCSVAMECGELMSLAEINSDYADHRFHG
ncbi:hypothetical protein CCL11_02415 [Pseudomonas syringae]|nr:hypothetical protein CCL11_02415 [Pseudomonas syringae]PBP63280.1 hypothetical protein CCL21_27095 [Pseudomonas syringae]